MRLALRTRPGVLAAALFALALVTFLPLRLVLGLAGIGDQGLAARRVEGSIWSGRLVEASVGSAALGDLDARLSPVPLLLGRARLVLDSVVDAPGRTVHGAVTSARHGFGIDTMTADVGVGRLFAPLPVTRLSLDGVTIRFADERCDMAEGRVRATLASAVGGLPLPGSLSGTVSCAAGALLVPLVSAGGGEAVRLTVTSDGRYHADFTVQPSDPATAQRLALAGFVEAAGGWRLSVEGRL